MAVKSASPVRVRVEMRFDSIFNSFLLSPRSGRVRRTVIVVSQPDFVKPQELFTTRQDEARRKMFPGPDFRHGG